MAKAGLVKLLDEALQLEYADIFLYPREADIIKEKDAEVSKKFEKFGRMELRHADNLAIQIHILGGRPTWEFTPLDVKEPIDEMLQDHLVREVKAIQRYDNLIEFVDKEGEEELKLILKGIKSEEEDHLKTIKELIERSKKLT